MAEPKENVLMEKIVSLCKRRGFIFQSSEIYGGINGFWDYGPLGAELKRNVKEAWWNRMMREREDVVGLDATIIMAPEIWKASGHVATFADLMVECPITKKRFRADQIEPLSGLVYSYAGMEGEDSIMRTPNRIVWPFSVLLVSGKNPESARKLAVQFYQQRYQQESYEQRATLLEPVLMGELVQKEDATTRFSPENGACLSDPRPFNLMFKTYVGPTATEADVAYLRPETAQAIFAQFKNVLDSSRIKVPFGIGQIGKAFRNEVTPRNYTFRSREFEQMELEFFIKPDEAIEAIHGSVVTVPETGHPGEPQPNWGWQAWHQYWVEERVKFYEDIGLSRNTLGFHRQTAEELAHYARACVDILFKFPFSKRDENGEMKGEELEGVAARSDFDLSQHQRFSGKPMGVFDEELRAAWGKLPKEKQDDLWRGYFNNRKKYLTKMGVENEAASSQATEDANGLAKGQYIPHVIEPSAGVDRLILALITNAYSETTKTDDKGKSETIYVMKFHPRISPIKVGVLPLLKNKPELVKKATEIRDLLRPWMNVFYDDGGSIGKRYARQDEAGTPFCVTVDFETFEGVREGANAGEKDTVTIRYRDDGRQERVKISELLNLLLQKVR